jgi:hypothetical protein
MIRDRGSKLADGFDAVLASEVIHVLRTSARTPRANAIVERWAVARAEINFHFGSPCVQGCHRDHLYILPTRNSRQCPVPARTSQRRLRWLEGVFRHKRYCPVVASGNRQFVGPPFPWAEILHAGPARSRVMR